MCVLHVSILLNWWKMATDAMEFVKVKCTGVSTCSSLYCPPVVPTPLNAALWLVYTTTGIQRQVWSDWSRARKNKILLFVFWLAESVHACVACPRMRLRQSTHSKHTIWLSAWVAWPVGAISLFWWAARLLLVLSRFYSFLLANWCNEKLEISSQRCGTQLSWCMRWEGSTRA